MLSASIFNAVPPAAPPVAPPDAAAFKAAVKSSKFTAFIMPLPSPEEVFYPSARFYHLDHATAGNDFWR